MPDDHDAAPLDRLVERAGRWTAGRLTRRSFVARAGRTALVVAGGTAITALWADPAGARVCGQSGVSPQCADFDCHDGVWGWCWYSTGCCAGGLLKKICDCCVRNYPNVHGYCPSGHNVKCIVESCDEDPRLQRVDITKILSDDPGTVADHLRRLFYPSGSPYVVIGDADDELFAAVGTAYAGALRAPLLVVTRKPLSDGALAEIRRLGAAKVAIASPLLPTSIDDQLTAAGIAVVRPGSSDDVGVYSAELAAQARDAYGLGKVTVVGAPDVLAVRAVAAAFAGAMNAPLVIGADHAPADATTAFLLGPEAVQHASSFATPRPFGNGDPVLLSMDLFAAATAAPQFDGRLVLGAYTSRVLDNLAAVGAPLLLHDPNSVDRIAPVVAAARGLLRHAFLGGLGGSLGSPAFRKLQSLFNGFEIDRLIGVAGQGLPVYSQPLGERPIGQARRGASPPPARFASRTWGNAGRRRITG